ncbi:MAG: DUF642 domain-containing protein [Chthoniobacterales bacterium]
MKAKKTRNILSPAASILVSSALLLGLGTQGAQADQIQNGGFEQPATSTFLDVVAPDNSSIPNWSVTAGSVDVVNAVGNGFDVGPAFAGAQYLDLNGFQAGTIAQTFNTLAGVTYNLQFAYANNYNPPTSLSAQLLLTGVSSTLLNTTVTHSTSVAGNLDWTLATFAFTADGSSATLSFHSLNQGVGGIFLDGVSVTQAVPVPLSAVSRKTHGATGDFDINLPFIGTPGVECRSNGGTNDFTLVITFGSSISVTGSPQAEVISGIATVGSGGVSNGGMVMVSGSTVTVPLTHVANAQTINVRLNAVNGSTNVLIPMSILAGDVNGSGAVSASDIGQTKAQAGQAVTGGNFRADVNANGAISGTDVALVKSLAGTSLGGP